MRGDKGSKGSKAGIGLIEILIGIMAILFLMKVCGLKIPWVWVFSPIWIPAMICIIAIGVWEIVTAAKNINEKMKRRKWH